MPQDTSTRQTTETAGAPEDETAEREAGEELVAPSFLSRVRSLPRPHPRRAWRRWKASHPVPAQVIGIVVTLGALALIVAALVMPNRLETFRPAEFMRLPAEAILGAAVLTALPRRPRLMVAVLFGLVLGVLTVLNLLDIGFNEYLGRGFNLILDWELLTDAQSYLGDSMGKGTGRLAAVGGSSCLSLLMPRGDGPRGGPARATCWAGTPDRRPGALLVAGAFWITCSALGLQIAGVPLASEHTAAIAQVPGGAGAGHRAGRGGVREGRARSTPSATRPAASWCRTCAART